MEDIGYGSMRDRIYNPLNRFQVYLGVCSQLSVPGGRAVGAGIARSAERSPHRVLMDYAREAEVASSGCRFVLSSPREGLWDGIW